jgi:hypothetical protein
MRRRRMEVFNGAVAGLGKLLGSRNRDFWVKCTGEECKKGPTQNNDRFALLVRRRPSALQILFDIWFTVLRAKRA